MKRRVTDFIPNKKWPRHVLLGFVLGLFAWGSILFKSFEVDLYPVIKNFQITEVRRSSDEVMIYGTMEKVRDCEFKGLIVYSGGAIIDIRESRIGADVSRVRGAQDWGWWIITPAVTELTLYVRHKCSTGDVLTKLYDGVII